MLLNLLFFNIGHFSLNVFTAFVYFAAGLLFLDAWQLDKAKKITLIRGIGFFLLSVVAVYYASSYTNQILQLIFQFIKISGLSFILFSLIKEPVLHKPGKKKLRIIIPTLLPMLTISSIPLSAAILFMIAVLYFRLSTEGMEKQRKPVALAFFLLFLAEIVSIAFNYTGTSNVFWSKNLAEFGYVWNIQHIFEFIGISILAFWIWGYLRFRLQIQLFAATVGLTLVIFILMTSFFTFLLLKNLETDALSHLHTDVNVLQYALDRMQLEALSHTKNIVRDSSFRQAFIKNEKSLLYTVTSDYMLSQGTSFLDTASSSGEVMMRAEDKDRFGDNIADDPVIKSALAGKPLATIMTNPGITYPEVMIKAAVPVDGGGAVVSGYIIDSAFVDGVKDVTGLDITVFGGNKRAATTFIAPDGKSRFVGTLESNADIIKTVLEDGKVYVGPANVLNQPYYTAYTPLKTYGDKPIGMLFVGKPQTTLIGAAKKSIDLTFLGNAILILISIIPAYFLSRYINENLEA